MTRRVIDQPRRGRGEAPKRPRLWHGQEATVLAEFPDGGGFPPDFLPWAYRTLGVTDPSRVLHMCSGGVRTGITVDIRAELEPTIVADARAIPLPDASIDWIIADPPYTGVYHRELYGGSDETYPKPSQLLREAGRLLVPGGRVGFLHYLLPRQVPPLRFDRVYGVTFGFNFSIRAWSIFRKDEAGLFEEAGE